MFLVLRNHNLSVQPATDNLANLPSSVEIEEFSIIDDALASVATHGGYIVETLNTLGPARTDNDFSRSSKIVKK